ncbi:MAG: hypothetical protein AB7N80_09880 [Bdellovibrionales bacterium]
MNRRLTVPLFLVLAVLGLLFAAGEIGAANAAKSKHAKAKKTSNKATCGQRELSQKDCHLWVGNTKLNLLKENWRFNDGLWLGVHDVPLNAPDTQWDKVRLEQFGERRFLQMWIWSSPIGEAAVQNLNWFVMELGERESPVRVQQVVQRRRRLGPPKIATEAVEGVADRKPAAVQFVYDPRDKTELKAHKGQLKWSAGRRHGEF